LSPLSLSAMHRDMLDATRVFSWEAEEGCGSGLTAASNTEIVAADIGNRDVAVHQRRIEPQTAVADRPARHRSPRSRRSSALVQASVRGTGLSILVEIHM